MQCISSSGDPQAKGTREKSYLVFSDRARGGTHNQETSEDARSGIDGSNICHHLNREIHHLLCFPLSLSLFNLRPCVNHHGKCKGEHSRLLLCPKINISLKRKKK